jgi:hypothetical protein
MPTPSASTADITANASAPGRWGCALGKRSSFERVERDFYPTPYEAVVPLLAHLESRTLFIEPCAGDSDLIGHLHKHGHRCIAAYDINPEAACGSVGDAKLFTLDPTTYPSAIFITNPPWSRSELHPIIERLSSLRPTWLLFDADWMHTRQSAPFMPWLRKIVSVGRVKWIPDSPFTGKDNCCWYLFDQTSDAPAQFVGRAA